MGLLRFHLTVMCKAITSLVDDILQDCYVVTKSETVELYCIVLSQVVYDEKNLFCFSSQCNLHTKRCSKWFE